jgi:hypothetical protein
MHPISTPVLLSICCVLAVTAIYFIWSRSFNKK